MCRGGGVIEGNHVVYVVVHYASLQDFRFVFRLQRTKKEKSDAPQLSVKMTESAENENEENDFGIGIFSIVWARMYVCLN